MFQVRWLFNWFYCWFGQFYWYLRNVAGEPPPILTFFWSIGLVQILNEDSLVFRTLHIPSFMPSQYSVKNHSRFVVISIRLAIEIDEYLSWYILEVLQYILDMLLYCDIHKDSIFQIWLYENEESDLTKKYYSLLWYSQGYEYF